MAWVMTQSATLPSPITAAGTSGNAPAGAIEVPMDVAVAAVGNPAAYVLNAETVSVTGPEGKTIEQTQYTLTAAPLSLQAAKLQQSSLIRQAFDSAQNAPVTDSNGNVWNGGFDSALKINGAVQLAQIAGSTSITLYDINNVPHQMTIAQAQAVAMAVGAAYQAAFARKQSLLTQIAAAASVSAVQAITW